MRKRGAFLVAIGVVALFASACVPPPPPVDTLPDAPVGAATNPIGVNVGARGVETIDFPDPAILKVGDTYYAYSTGSGSSSIQVIKSPDLVHWTWVGDAFVGPEVSVMQNGSPWAELWATTWAPAVLERPANPPDKRFVLYYAAKSVVSPSAGMQCIGRAWSSTPEGPFYDEETQPFVCTPDRGGSIDPSPIVDNGQVYLLFQSYGIAPTEPTRIWSIPLTGDGLSLAWLPTQVIEVMDGTFEWPNIEAPAMMPAPGGGFLLYYSSGAWWMPEYKVVVAWCQTPTSPCTRIYRSPVLATRDTMTGPGGQDVFQDGSGNWYMVFHAWSSPNVGYDHGGRRMLHILPITFPAGNHDPKVG